MANAWQKFLAKLEQRVSNFRPLEMSFVDVPANRRPFCVIKSAGGERKMEFTKEQVELLKAAGVDVEKLAKMSEEEQAEIIADLEKAAGDADEEPDEGRLPLWASALLAKCISVITAQKSAEEEPEDDSESDDEPEKDPRIAELENANAELAKRLDAREKETIIEKAVGTLDSAPITPGSKEALRPIVAYLAGEGAVILQKSEDGKEVEVSMADHLVEVITEREEGLRGLLEEVGEAGRIDGATDAWEGYERTGVTPPKPDNGNDK